MQITRELLDTKTEDKLYNKVVSATQERKKKKAAEFEKQVENKLLELGVKFLTEEHIRNKMGGMYHMSSRYVNLLTP